MNRLVRFREAKVELHSQPKSRHGAGISLSALSSFEGIPSWGRSSAGRAPALQAGGQEFDSPRLHHIKYGPIAQLVRAHA